MILDTNIKDEETIHLYDASMEKLEVLAPPGGMSDKLGELLDFHPYMKHTEDPPEHVITKKVNLTQPRSVVLKNGAPLRL